MLPFIDLSSHSLETVFLTTVFKFNKVQLIICLFVFYGLCLSCFIKKSLLYPKSLRFSLMSYSRNFIILYFTFSFVINLELIFGKDIRSVSRIIFYFYFLHLDIQLFQNHLFKILYFLHCAAFVPLSKINWLYLHDSISVLLIYLSIVSQISHWLFNYGFIVIAESDGVSPLILYFFNLGLHMLRFFLPLHIYFRISFWYTQNNLLGFLLELH